VVVLDVVVVVDVCVAAPVVVDVVEVELGVAAAD
jgi:hypothetical protein